MRSPSLRTRLFVAFAVVAVIGGVVFALVIRSLVPRLFDGNMGMHDGSGMNGSGMNGPGGMGGAAQDTRDAVVSAVNTAMVAALATSLAVALLLAVWLGRRTLRNLDQVRAGTRALRAGNYTSQLASPPEPELRALVDDINDLAAALAHVEQRRAALIGDVAHEMRTPLTTIAGNLEGLQDGLFTADEAVAAITIEVDRLQHLARDLAAVSRAEEGALGIEPVDLDLGDLVTAVAQRLRPTADAGQVRLSVATDDATPVRADPGRLEQAIANLVGNAIAYTPAGGHVQVTVSRSDGRATVMVVDDGRGLEPDQLRQVFDRFYRADPSDHTGGTGVGLTIARSIARAHGGDLTAQSDGPGRGARFTLSLPA